MRILIVTLMVLMSSPAWATTEYIDFYCYEVGYMPSNDLIVRVWTSGSHAQIQQGDDNFNVTSKLKRNQSIEKAAQAGGTLPQGRYAFYAFGDSDLTIWIEKEAYFPDPVESLAIAVRLDQEGSQTKLSCIGEPWPIY